jgi:hypothetical protein
MIWVDRAESAARAHRAALVRRGAPWVVLACSACAHADAVRAKEAGAQYLDCPVQQVEPTLIWERGDTTLWEVECRDTEQLSSAQVRCDRTGCAPVVKSPQHRQLL